MRVTGCPFRHGRANAVLFALDVVNRWCTSRRLIVRVGFRTLGGDSGGKFTKKILMDLGFSLSFFFTAPLCSGGVRPALLQFILGHCPFSGLTSVPLRGQWGKHVTALLVKIPTVTVNPADHSIQMLAPDVCLSALARASRTASHAL